MPAFGLPAVVQVPLALEPVAIDAFGGLTGARWRAVAFSLNCGRVSSVVLALCFLPSPALPAFLTAAGAWEGGAVKHRRAGRRRIGGDHRCLTAPAAHARPVVGVHG
jgi:hypothetical protein